MYSKKKNYLYLVGPVNEDMFRQVLRASDHKPGLIVLNTPGGDFYQSLAIYDWIQDEMPDTKILAAGHVMSAGMVILQSAGERIAYENTQFMLHYGEEHATSLTWKRHFDKMTELHIDILCKRSSLSRRKLTNWFEKDVILTAEEALEYGLIDNIIGVDE